MPEQLALQDSNFEAYAVSPFYEMGAYEALWDQPGATFRSIANTFRAHPGSVPSDFVSQTKALEYASFVNEKFLKANVQNYGVRVHGAGEYPEKLRDARHPVELLYYQGWWDLVNSRCIAIVGTRKPTKEGIARTKKLVKSLVKDGFTIVSGLANGIDRVAHETAIEAGGRTIAVIGTPLTHIYPKENKALQDRIASQFLVISQVPVKKYLSQDYRRNRTFFPERNVTMSALTEATIIVEAGETSGTLIQARAALHQGRKLFILDSCFNKSKLTWPKRFENKGAIRVKEYEDIKASLENTTN